MIRSWSRARRVVLAAVLVSLGLLARDAEAADTACPRVEREMFEIDGMLDDWRGFRGRKVAGSRDLGLVVRCAYDATSLYVSLNVRDESVVRTRRAQPAREDHAAIRLQAGGRALNLRYLPGAGRVPPKVLGPKFVEMADSLQPQGWSLEARVPLAKVAGWSRTVPYLRARVAVKDADRSGGGPAQARLDGRLHFGQAASNFAAFLRATRLRRSDLRLDELADVDPGKGPERVVAGRNIVGVLGDGFTYMTLPVASPGDILDLRLVDFDGSGRKGILGHFRQHGNGGSRELVAVWFAEGDGRFSQAIAFEVAKEMGGRTLRSEWQLVPRGLHRGRGKRQRGTDILVTAAEASGWDATSFQEIPAPDVRPIVLPWGERPAELHYFEGTTSYTEESPKLDKKKRRR